MNRYLAAPYLDDLSNFQRRTVNHVFHQLYGPTQAKRFLVADETGLGKTRVARGLIARAIEHLQDDESVQRIDVVYVCSNSDLAQQNITRLNVTGEEAIPFASRLTMLGSETQRLTRRKGRTTAKPVNLVSFTPGTSFEHGHSLGQSKERAMLLIAITAIHPLGGYETTAAHRLLQGQVRTVERFRQTVDELRYQMGDVGIDPPILRAFRRSIKLGGRSSLLNRFLELVDEMGRKRSVPDDLYGRNVEVVREMRAALARASVETLEPDLVILDEFQRFRHLLDPDTPAGELAHHLFEFEAAKVLLLSATPYKPFTYAEETGEDHASDLFNTLGFLAKGRHDVDMDQIRAQLREYRDVVTRGHDGQQVIPGLRTNLLKVMSRAERPVLSEGAMSVEHVRTATNVTAEDLLGYAALHRVGDVVSLERDRGLVTTEYWKSAPYFINFCEGYRLGQRIGDAPSSDALDGALKGTQQISGRALQRFRPLDPGNPRLRALVQDTLDQGWWRLLWMPPSLPYVAPSGPYAEPSVQGITKRLVFSSWTATPTAVAAILSYEAERRMAAGTNYTEYTPENRRRLAKHLQYPLRGGAPARMSTLLLQWPMAELAAAVDPLRAVREAGGSALSSSTLRAWARRRVEQLLDLGTMEIDSPSEETSNELREADWRAVFAQPGNWPAEDEVSDEELSYLLSGRASDEEEEVEDLGGLAAHISRARTALSEGPVEATPDTVDVLAEVALFSPGNIALRALTRLVPEDDRAEDVALFEAAAILANGLRSLFNRPDAIKVVERVDGTNRPYWRQVLAYCAAGNLEAVLDEYLHHLVQDLRNGPVTGDVLVDLAGHAANALSLRTSSQRALDASDLDSALSFVPRFALRYGGRRATGEDARQPEVRQAFNSPFWPFVLASTSVGQEGVDFHWWCHAVFHWNIPANPVDFEQREGRVDRYRGHAIRKNIAARHGASVLTPGDTGHPWDRLYEAAHDFDEQYGGFAPDWVYPGSAKIERHVAPILLSSDAGKYARIKRDVALYRLTFGQPRQEDLLELLRRHQLGVDLRDLRIDLAP